MKRYTAELTLLVAFIVLALLSVCGCQSYHKANPAPAPNTPSMNDNTGQINDALTRAMVRRSVIVEALEQAAKAGTPAEAKPQIATAQRSAEAQGKDLDEAKAQTAQARANETKYQAEIATIRQADAEKYNKLADEHNRLQGEWYVVWGLRIEHAIFWITVTWIAAGVAGTLLTIFGGGVWFNIGRWLLSALPLANCFTWAANKWGVVRA